MGAVGTVALGGAAAVTYAGHASPTNPPASQSVISGSNGTDPAANGGSSSLGSGSAGSAITGGGEHRHHSSSSVPLGQSGSSTGVAPGNPGSGLVTSGGS